MKTSSATQTDQPVKRRNCRRKQNFLAIFSEIKKIQRTQQAILDQVALVNNFIADILHPVVQADLLEHQSAQAPQATSPEPPHLEPQIQLTVAEDSQPTPNPAERDALVDLVALIDHTLDHPSYAESWDHFVHQYGEVNTTLETIDLTDDLQQL